MRRLLLSSALLLVLLLLIGLLLGQRLLYAPLSPSQPVEYQLEPGTSLSQVAMDLEQRRVLRSAWSLKLLGRTSGQAGLIQSGRYRFSDAARPGQILQRLVDGDVLLASLTIPEGFTQDQVFKRIDELGYGQQARLEELASDPVFLQHLKLPGQSLEGYLFPETYRFTPGTSEADLLTMMVAQFRNRISPGLEKKAAAHHLDLHQLVTLASIIEKETGLVEEMPLISSVFHNRLQRHIPLQTDPTVIYGLADFDGNLTRRDLQAPSPYNTYLYSGLPPGPIANPGLAALQAAAEPAESKYLYFVAKGDGSHHFSKTLKEHNQAVRRYQLKRRN